MQRVKVARCPCDVDLDSKHAVGGFPWEDTVWSYMHVESNLPARAEDPEPWEEHCLDVTWQWEESGAEEDRYAAEEWGRFDEGEEDCVSDDFSPCQALDLLPCEDEPCDDSDIWGAQ